MQKAHNGYDFCRASLVAGVRTQAEFDVMFRGLKQAITERILRAELTEHLGYPEGETRPAPRGCGGCRGSTRRCSRSTRGG